MKLKTKLSVALCGATTLHFASSYMAFRSLLDRTYNTPEFLINTFHKKKSNKKPHIDDERENWFNTLSFTEFSIENADKEKLPEPEAASEPETSSETEE